MIRKILVNLSAEHPEIPLIEAATFVGSPSAVFVRGIPPAVGSWRITSVKVVATYPDNSAPTVECVKGADGVYVATIPATTTSGRVTNGLQIIADGIDERGEAVAGYVLGMADFAVYLRDMTIEGATGVKYYLHLLDAPTDDPKEGDAYLDGTALNIYHDGEWTEIAGGGYEPPPGGIPKTDLSAGVQASLDKADSALQTAPVTSVNNQTGAVSLTASDVGAIPIAGGVVSGNLRFSNGNYFIALIPNDAFGVSGPIITLSDGHGNVAYFTPTGISISNTKFIAFPSVAGTLALLSDIAVKSVKLNGMALTPDANGAVNVQAIAPDAYGNVRFPTVYDHYLVLNGYILRFDNGPDTASYIFDPNVAYNESVVRRQDLAPLAPLDSPAFTGTPTVPPPAAGDDSTRIATTAFVNGAVAGVPLRYDMPTAVALVAENDAATLVCADRAVTNATIAAGFSTLNLTFPDAISGKVRDFYMRITVAAGESAPALSIPQGITIENPDGAVPEIADGETSATSTTLVWFSETAPNVFTAKAETVKAVA